MEIKAIAVTTDFSDTARTCYSVARELADRFKASLSLVHTTQQLPLLFYPPFGGVSAQVEQRAYIVELEARLRSEVESQAVFRDVDVEPVLLVDQFAQIALSRYAVGNEIDLVVTATHGAGGWRRALLGSYVEKLVQVSDVPVLVGRAPREDSEVNAGFKRIIVPFDFSENAKAALPVLRRFASAFGARCTFVYVLEPLPPVVLEVPGSVVVASLESARAAAPENAKRRFEELKTEHLDGVECELVIQEGQPAAEVTRFAEAESADLIITATHGWRGVRQFLLGSVAEKVVRGAPCSVLVVRSPLAD